MPSRPPRSWPAGWVAAAQCACCVCRLGTVRDQWDGVVDWENATVPETIGESFVHIIGVVEELKTRSRGVRTAKTAGLAASAAAGGDLAAAALFQEMEASITPALAKKVGVIYQWNITKGGKTAGVWTLDLKSSPPSVYRGEPKSKPGCTLTVSDDDVVALATGKLDSMKAFMGGKLKIGGNMMLAQKLKPVFDAAKASKAAAPASKPKAGANSGLKAAAVFDEMATAVDAALVKKVKAIYQWNITKDGKTAGQVSKQPFETIEN